MKPRPTYLLLFLLLFAKGNSYAIPAHKAFIFPAASKNSFVHQADCLDQANIDISPGQNSFINDDNDEEEEDAGPSMAQTIPASTFNANLFATGFLIYRFKNAAYGAIIHSSYPPVYLRFGVIRI